MIFLVERLFWFIKLRWIAVLGVAAVSFLSREVFRINIPVNIIYAFILILVLYNLAVYLLVSYLDKKKATTVFWLHFLANFQVSFDLLTLSFLIHFTGGIENPFIFYFIFHMIISGITLSFAASYFQATFAVVLFLGMAIFEYLGIIPHYAILGYLPFPLYNNFLYIFGVSFVFITTLYLAVYMAFSVASKLKKSEAHLEELNKQLQEKDRIKNEYVLRVTHDIKENLSSIVSCIEPVENETIGALEPKQKELLSRVVSRAYKLLAFVRALLEITRLKLSQELKACEFSFTEMIDAIVKDIETRASDKGVSFTAEIASTIKNIKGVKVYIEEALNNILINAVKYTLRGGEIYFKVEDKGKYFLIKIQDSGIGISKEDIPFIFDEFYRAQNAKTLEKMGTGLGLSISYKIVKMHKGRIWVESEINKGSTFYIELPKY